MWAMVVFVTIARNMIESNPAGFGFTSPFSLLAPFEAYQADKDCIVKMEKLIKQVQGQNQHTLAAGLMAWLHTLRAVSAPKLRLLTRGMWEEVARGFPNADATARAMGITSIRPQTYPLVPAGFRPQDKSNS